MNPHSSDYGRRPPHGSADPEARGTGRLHSSDPRHPLHNSADPEGRRDSGRLHGSDPRHPLHNSADPEGRRGTGRLRGSDPRHPLHGSSPSNPALHSSDPNHPALRSSDPNHPALRSSDPNHAALRSSDPNHAALRSSDPRNSALRHSNPDNSAYASGFGRTGGRRGPKRIGRYHLHEELGRGNYGVVYRATREGLDRPFAIKILTSSVLQNEEAQARFEREARVASKLDHPGIVPVFDVGKEGGLPFFVMDFVPGKPLSARLKEQGRLKPPAAARLVAALADALAVAHEKGVIHRDLKPDNVMLQPPGDTPRIMDFGLARDTNAGMTLTKTGEAVGTPFYMAPEQIRGKKDVDGRADVYALGVLLYQCMTGRVPFPGSTFMEIAQRVRQGWAAPPTQLVPSIPKRLEEICLKAMALQRDDRYPDATALREDLITFLRASGELEAVEDGPADRRPIVIAAVVTAVLAILTLVVLGVFLRKQARENQARALIAEAGSANEPAAAAALLDQAEALADGDADLLARVKTARDGQVAAAALKRLHELMRDGGPGEVKVHLDGHRDLAPVAKEANRLASELLAQSDAARTDPGLEDRAIRQLARAQELAVDEALREKIQAADRGLRARRLLRRGNDASRRDAQTARGLLTQAETLAGDDLALRKQIRTALSGLDVRAQLATVWRAGNRGAKLPELLRRIEEASSSAGGDPELLAEVALARVEAHYKRGSYAKAIDLAKRLSGRADRNGYVARYMQGMSEFRLERAGDDATKTLRGVMAADPNGIGGLLAAAFVNTVMVRDGAPQGEVCAKRVLQKEPNNVDALVSLAFALHNQGRYAAAWRQAQKAMKAGPDHPRAFLAKGFIQQASGDSDLAIEGYSEVVKLTEPRPMRRALSRRAQLYRQLKRYTAAVADLNRLLDEKPDDVGTLILRAAMLGESGRTREALRDWKRASELNPAWARQNAERLQEPMRSKVMKALTGADATDDPAPTPGKGPKARTFDPKTPLGRAVALHRAGEPLPKVRKAFEAALDAAKGKEADTVRVELADMFYRRGQPQPAFEALRPLLQRKDALGQRARFLQAFCQLWADAGTTIHTFRAAFHMDRKSIWGLNAGSALHVLSNRIDRGIELGEKGVAADPAEIETYITLVFAYSSRPAYHRKGVRTIRQVIKVAPRHARAHLAHAYILRARGNNQGMLKALARSIEVSQPKPIRHALQMRCQATLQSDPKQAIADADELLKRNPRDPGTVLLKALACEFSGDRKRADAAWKAGFKLNRRTFEHYARRTLANDPQRRDQVLKLADD